MESVGYVGRAAVFSLAATLLTYAASGEGHALEYYRQNREDHVQLEEEGSGRGRNHINGRTTLWDHCQAIRIHVRVPQALAM